MWEPVKIELSEAERERLEGMTRSRTLPARLVLTARIILLAADGLSNRAIGADLGIDFKSAMRWRNRFLAERFEGIEKERPGRGRKRMVKAETVQEVDRPPPPAPGHPPDQFVQQRQKQHRLSAVSHSETRTHTALSNSPLFLLLTLMVLLRLVGQGEVVRQARKVRNPLTSVADLRWSPVSERTPSSERPKFVDTRIS